MKNLNQWEVKQIIEVVSKGVNSLLMAGVHDTDVLKEVGDFLTEYYKNMVEDLKDEDEPKSV